MGSDVKYIQDYREPEYLVPRSDLLFDIYDKHVRVSSTLRVKANSSTVSGTPLVLNGERLDTVTIELDGSELTNSAFQLDDKLLVIPDVPRAFTLRTVVDIDPYNNTWLEGLYKSGDILCSQNESEGFRKITWFTDRPDVMSVFTTTITADRKRFPLLLSNGNRIEEQDLGDGRHLVRWHDPFPKPCYLFALVAGDLAVVEDSYTTRSGRNITLRIFVDRGNEDRVGHAMRSLKKAMRWDEDTFGLEYDLDLFMIVAVDAFNYGAMENKGLNIFNSACALANPETATDTDFQRIESIVAHEYFHNWTGDRVTLRDWFQITLKEGLTVFRDAEFSADMHSRPIKRITDSENLRTIQFVEDAGPNAHPIQPQSYREVSNFYTSTVYEKGAEVIRMLQIFFGKDGFRKGIDRYFELYDGKPVTTGDFLLAMEQGNAADLAQFRRWYHQAGTPECKVVGRYDPAAHTYALTVTQTCPPTADGSPKEPFCFPMAVGLLDRNGNDLPLALDADEPRTRSAATDHGKGRPQDPATTRVLTISRPRHTFLFIDVPEEPLPSLFRNFSAPVKVRFDCSHDDLVFLMAHDSDLFNRYDAGQRLALKCLLKLVAAIRQNRNPSLPDGILDASATLIEDQSLDRSFCARALTLPSISTINQELDIYDFQAAYRAREAFRRAMAQRYADSFRRFYDLYASDHHAMDRESVNRREFRNLCLDYLACLDDMAVDMANAQFGQANNMTDRLAALRLLCRTDTAQREEALAAFRKRWEGDFNVLNKWFAVQALATDRAQVYEDVLALAQDPLFDGRNPNRLRSLYGAFAANLVQFHHESGRGYRLIADKAIEIDRFNNLVSALFGKAFKHYPRMDAKRKALMKDELERIVSTPDLSTGLHEVISNTLKEG